MEHNLALHILFSHKDVALVCYQRNVNYKESAEIIKGLFEQFDAQNFDFSEMSIEEAQKAVIKTVEANGGGIVESDLDAARKLFPEEAFNESPDPTQGLVAITYGSSVDLNYVADSKALIDLSDRTFKAIFTNEYRTYSWSEINEVFDEAELNMLANRLNTLIYEADPWDHDEIASSEDGYEQVREELAAGNFDGYVDFLQSVIDCDGEYSKEASSLLDQLSVFQKKKQNELGRIM